MAGVSDASPDQEHAPTSAMTEADSAGGVNIWGYPGDFHADDYGVTVRNFPSHKRQFARSEMSCFADGS
jgi:hypothetical protein